MFLLIYLEVLGAKHPMSFSPDLFTDFLFLLGADLNIRFELSSNKSQR